MLKHKEIFEPNSCLNKARANESLFILLGRDPAAPAAVEAWIYERLALGLNDLNDPKIQEAFAWINNRTDGIEVRRLP